MAKQKERRQNHNDWWDAGKLYFKAIAIDYCTKVNKQINKKQQTLIDYISQEKSTLNPNNEQIHKYQQELNDIEINKSHGTIIWSKEKIILNEEKPTKYFYSQEKQKQTKKHITCLIDDKGKILLKNTEILNEWKNYHQKLCNKQNACQTAQKELLQNITPKISNIQNQKLKQQIQIPEIQEAIQNMENGKSPGVDGLPIEFNKEFFEILKKHL